MANLKFAHELDAAWIIAMWKWLHGYEEPYSEQKVAAEVIAAISSTLAAPAPETPSDSSIGGLQTRLKDIGVKFHSEAKPEMAVAPSTEARKTWITRIYCFWFKGQKICTQFPINLAQVQAPPE